MVDSIFEKLEIARKAGKISHAAVDNIKKWLNNDTLSTMPELKKEVIGLIEKGYFEELNDAFYTIIPFGTGGRRGRMGAGCNRINLLTIGESTQGFAQFLIENEKKEDNLRAVIAYDSRNNSKKFAEETARVFAGNGIKVYLFDDCRSTPELSFAVRKLKADAGVVISASHNPPPDNGFKAYMRDGGQVVPPYDSMIIDQVNAVSAIKRMQLDDARQKGFLEYIGTEVDEKYWTALNGLSLFDGDKGKLKVVFTPLHGTGITTVPPVFKKAGFKNLFLVEGQITPDGNFPNVKNNLPNPENPAVLHDGIDEAKRLNADIVLASDPDADRLGVAVKKSESNADWMCLTGNQIGTLLVYYVLSQLKEKNKLSANNIVVKTVVTTSAVDAIAKDFGVKLEGNLLVGFKYIARLIESLDEPDDFVFGAEESHGYLSGTFVRDKDAAIGALLISEFAAKLKEKGMTLYQKLQKIYCQYGYFKDLGASIMLEGSEGSAKMEQIYNSFKDIPPVQIGDSTVLALVDRAAGIIKKPDGTLTSVEGDKDKILIFVLSYDGRTRITVRPSGTEPKIKFYISAYAEIRDNALLEKVKSEVDAQAENLLKEIKKLSLDIIS